MAAACNGMTWSHDVMAWRGGMTWRYHAASCGGKMPHSDDNFVLLLFYKMYLLLLILYSCSSMNIFSM